MVVFYALGGGLGHLTRARRVAAKLGLDSDAVLLTASRHASDPRVTGGLEVVEVPQRLADNRSGFRRWVAAALREVQASELFVDTFPGGILGELCGLELPPAQLVARRLRWPAYRHRLAGPLPAYEAAHVIEPLSTAHLEVLSAIARRVEPLSLSDGRPPSGPPLLEQPHVLVVHGGPAEELNELIELAHVVRRGPQVRVLIASPRRPDRLWGGAAWCDVYPVAPHLHHAEAIVTAAGWAAMQDAERMRDRHRFMPFPRPLDDQFWRARWALRRTQRQAPGTLLT
jgi:hypothetical protein